VLCNSHKHDSVGDHRTNGANPAVEHGVVQADEVTNEEDLRRNPNLEKNLVLWLKIPQTQWPNLT
jgi:hypothetical protein